MPRPDACREIPREAVRKALGAPAAECTADPQEDAHGVRFQGAVKKTPVALVVSYQRRYSRKTGLDLWRVHGVISGERARLIGVGEDALFDPAAATATAVSEHLLVTVGLQSAKEIDREGLADRLLPVLESALEIGEREVAEHAPPTAPIIPTS
jgi:hypothetical protein